MQFLFLALSTLLVVGCSTNSNHNRVPSSLEMKDGEFYVKPGPAKKIYIKLSGYPSISGCTTPYIQAMYGEADIRRTHSQYICTADIPVSNCFQRPGKQFIANYLLKPVFAPTIAMACAPGTKTERVQLSTDWIEVLVTPYEGVLITAPGFSKIDISSRKEDFMTRMIPLKLKEPISFPEPPVNIFR